MREIEEDTNEEMNVMMISDDIVLSIYDSLSVILPIIILVASFCQVNTVMTLMPTAYLINIPLYLSSVLEEVINAGECAGPETSTGHGSYELSGMGHGHLQGCASRQAAAFQYGRVECRTHCFSLHRVQLPPHWTAPWVGVRQKAECILHDTLYHKGTVVWHLDEIRDNMLVLYVLPFQNCSTTNVKLDNFYMQKKCRCVSILLQ